ncbi:hypothetical protein ncot_15890 [Nocardioides sp. JQ2195]|uniref:hypothetical protein n=1 Tax=Nocardioides sp. JQ2195 TaxID=2592334 RepID=UPI00143E1B9E|nr:hypothetical protein [Nocardioides sp. JQ2195]QIX27901.1 hypothetical protein ncot_15890 [Nocardioides sp. JQ2195]
MVGFSGAFEALGVSDMGPRGRLWAVGATAAVTALVMAAPVSAEDETGDPAVPLSSCWSRDAGLPTLGTPTFTPSTVDVTDQPAEVLVSLPVQDRGGPGAATGVSSVWIYVLDQVIRLEPTSTDAWTGRVSVQRRTEPGEHTIESIEATDKAGNRRHTEEDGVFHSALETPLTVVSDPPPEPVVEPALTSLTISKQKVSVRKKARKVAFHLAVDESTTTVQSVGLRFNSKPSQQVELSRTTDGFTGTARVPRSWFGTYRAKVASVQVLDEYGFVHRTHTRELADRFGIEPVKVIARDDERRPRIVKTTVSPTSIDARTKRRKVTVTVKTRDDRSGVNSVQVNIGPEVSVAMRKIRGTRRANTWRGSTRVGPCDVPYRQGKLLVQVRDRALRSDDALDTRLRVRTDDLRRPAVSLAHPRRAWSAEGPIRVLFDERVTGVNDDSLLVVRRDGLYWSAPLTGTLSCRNGAGTKVSCGSERVREARWQPAPGELEPGRRYAVMPNPDAVLDIRDRAGNPARRSVEDFETKDEG